MTHLKVFCQHIFERDLSDAAKAPTHSRKFLFSKVSQIELFLTSILNLSFAYSDLWLASQNWL